MNTKANFVVASVLAALAGCSSQSTAPTTAQTVPTSSQLGACASNFTIEGGFWSGMRFSTFEEFPKKTANNAFDALLRSVAASGYQVNSSNKEAGMISASQTVSYGEGKTAPLNFVIRKLAQSGVRVEVSFSTSGGVSAPTDAVQKEFCKLLASVDQSASEVASASTSPSSKNNSASTPKKKAKKATTE